MISWVPAGSDLMQQVQQVADCQLRLGLGSHAMVASRSVRASKGNRGVFIYHASLSRRGSDIRMQKATLRRPRWQRRSCGLPMVFGLAARHLALPLSSVKVTKAQTHLLCRLAFCNCSTLALAANSFSSSFSACQATRLSIGRSQDMSPERKAGSASAA